MKKIILIIAAISLLASCKTVKTQGIQGTVNWISGNQMPGPDKKNNAAPKGVVREIRIYQAIFIGKVQSHDGSFFDETIGTPILVVKSLEDGTFKASLPPGKYSVFTKEARGLFANQYDGEGCINCVEVKPNEFTPVIISVDYDAAY
ncbi:carboxypeptidase regulatory-like domain-containing protein [Pseudochryseolinea flava]|uniref:Carboxypeptidase regulatory-like domain-containing protein n=1 Tax=Pseudochryseolinea flava TaxID=2059302 RepID=A0A364XVG8_9BACT|nr:carboxypeptidase regulatory-like domain-containing protein [Pseudochryseolinea flava]RAV98319.1 carboxypeptidase regulatory-like domain-containing protein [Pseudochryseolinea flava]